MAGVFSLPLLDSRGELQEFIAGEENALVRMARRAVLENDHPFFPLVICGLSGVGKTHLARGLADSWQRESSDRLVWSTTGIDFARQYADAVDTDSLADFRGVYERVGLILIDDVSRLLEKPAAVREMLRLLDASRQADQLVICTSSMLPDAMQQAPALASRLAAGLAFSLQSPAAETRRELLAHFAKRRRLTLNDLLLDQVAQGAPEALSVRELDGIVLQLDTNAKLVGSPLDRNYIATFLAEKFPVSNAQIDLSLLFASTAKRFGVSVAELRGPSRRQTIVRARAAAILLARRLTSASFQMLGNRLGGRDHTTVIHAHQKAEVLARDDEAFRASLYAIDKELTVPPAATKKKRGKRNG